MAMTTLEENLIKCWLYDPNRFYEEIALLNEKKTHRWLEGILLFRKLRYQPESVAELLKFVNQENTHHSSDVVNFFYFLTWFYWSVSIGRKDEAKSILSQLEMFSSSQHHLVLQAEILLCKTLTTDKKDGLHLFHKGVSLLPTDSVRYQNSVKNLMDSYSSSGRLNFMDKKLIEKIPKEFVDFFSFLHAVENGQLEEALVYKKTVIENMPVIPDNIKLKFNNSICLLDFYLEKNIDGKMNEWLLPVQALLQGNHKLALETAKGFHSRCHMLGDFFMDFFRFSLIRSYLVNKNVDAARREIDRWKVKVNNYCLADFFYARIELLSGNMKKAGEYFAKAKKTCVENNAMGRLDFELELSHEMQPKQIRYLMDYSAEHAPQEVITVPSDEMAKTESEEEGIYRIKGISRQILEIKDEVLKYAASDIPVLILGETGVGKDLIAKSIHEESKRNKAPFIAINCSAISENLLQSELFGHEAGAYTGATKSRKGIFQEAGHGTVFLDEIGDISSGLQMALLRVLESGENRAVGSSKSQPIHCRIIAATNVFLEEKVNAAIFRKDLLFRLKRLVIKVPPLRDRPLDIPYLADYFLNRNRSSSENLELSPELKEAFMTYLWPGNIRELKNEIEKMKFLNSECTVFDVKEAKFLNQKNKIVSDKTKIRIAEPIKDETNENTNTKKAPPNILKDNVFQESGAYFRRINAIKALFIEHKQLTRKEICIIIGAHNFTIGKDLKHLLSTKFIKKIEPTTSPRTHYFELIDSKT